MDDSRSQGENPRLEAGIVDAAIPVSPATE
jgi:hypothetical protein